MIGELILSVVCLTGFLVVAYRARRRDRACPTPHQLKGTL